MKEQVSKINKRILKIQQEDIKQSLKMAKKNWTDTSPEKINQKDGK